MKSLVAALGLTALAMASCGRLDTDAPVHTSPASSARAECQRAHGVWQPALGACDLQGAGGAM